MLRSPSKSTNSTSKARGTLTDYKRQRSVSNTPQRGNRMVNSPSVRERRTMSPIQEQEEVVPQPAQGIEGPSKEFMERNARNQKPLMITDWDTYRKRNGLTKKDRVFICKGYKAFKKALVARGWHENTDRQSPIFHLKFTAMGKDIFVNQKGTRQNLNRPSGFELQDFQMVNHYYNCDFLTTKVGLTRNLRTLPLWSKQLALDDFYPKCFILSRQDKPQKGNSESAVQDPIFDWDTFREYFRVVWSESMLKRYNSNGKCCIEKVLIALSINEKRLLSPDQQLDKFGEVDGGTLVPDHMWAVLEMTNKQVEGKEGEAFKKSAWFKAIQEQYSDLLQGNQPATNNSLTNTTDDSSSPPDQQIEENEQNTPEILDQNNGDQANDQDQIVETTGNDQQQVQIANQENTDKDELIKQRVSDVLTEMEESIPQFKLNGSKNLWIVKPGAQNRGRGIQVMRNYDEIAKYLRTAGGGKHVVQKYIENPLIIENKKFDIRQWVLVTDWNPLTVWVYDECYIRLAAQDYDPHSNSRYTHLTNNCVVKQFHKGKEEEGCEDDSIDSNDEDGEEFDNILSAGDFAGHVQAQYQDKYGDCPDIYEQIIKPQIFKQVKASVQCVQDQVDNRKNSFEFYGYDFMVDDELNVWMIEVNSNPSIECKGQPILQELVHNCLTDLAKVVIDWQNKPNANVDTGGFKLAHRAKNEVFKPKSMGKQIDLSLQGTKCKRHKNRA